MEALGTLTEALGMLDRLLESLDRMSQLLSEKESLCASEGLRADAAEAALSSVKMELATLVVRLRDHGTIKEPFAAGTVTGERNAAACIQEILETIK